MKKFLANSTAFRKTLITELSRRQIELICGIGVMQTDTGLSFYTTVPDTSDNLILALSGKLFAEYTGKDPINIQEQEIVNMCPYFASTGSTINEIESNLGNTEYERFKEPALFFDRLIQKYFPYGYACIVVISSLGVEDTPSYVWFANVDPTVMMRMFTIFGSAALVNHQAIVEHEAQVSSIH